MAVQISGNDITVPRDTKVTRNLTVGGVLTYEDVTNVDSVGLVTARSGIEIGARPGVGASISVDGNAIFSGITTATTIKSNTGIVTTLTSTTFNVDGGDATFKGTTSGRDVIFDTSLNQIRAQDNAKLCAGSSSDLEIYHTGSASYIDNYTGALYLRNNVSSDVNGDIYIQAKSGENSVACYDDGAVELYNDNSRKLRTYSGGVKIASDSSIGRLVLEDTDGNFAWQLTGYDSASSTGGRGVFQDANGGTVLDMRASGGNIFSYNNIKLSGNGSADNLKLTLGASDDLQIYHDGSHSYVSDTSTGNLKLTSNGTAVQIEKSDGENMAIFRTDGAVELYNDNSKKFETTATGIKVISEESRIVQYDESNGVNERKVIYRGLGNTASGTFTASNCHGGGTVTVVGMNNGNGNISTTKMYPIHINSNGTATLGSIIFEINGSTSASSFSVSAAAQGISVTNGGGAFCQFRVTFDITANVS